MVRGGGGGWGGEGVGRAGGATLVRFVLHLKKRK